MVTRDKQYFAAASRRSRAKKKKLDAARDSPHLKKALAICVLMDTREWSLEQAVKYVDAKSSENRETPPTIKKM
jgi:hypothetical protein